VLIFLAGAGAAAFTGELAKKLATQLQNLAKKMMGQDEIGDGDALALATMHHPEPCSYAQLF
jgi:ribonuclease HIII